MRDELLHYYERELTFLRHMGAEFAERYPKVAGRLLLESGKCEDPHVERLLRPSGNRAVCLRVTVQSRSRGFASLPHDRFAMDGTFGQHAGARAETNVFRL